MAAFSRKKRVSALNVQHLVRKLSSRSAQIWPHLGGHTQALGEIQARSKARSQARSNQQLLLRPLPVAFCSNQGSGRAHACFLTHRALALGACSGPSGCQNCDPVARCPACAPGGQGIWDVPGRVPDHVHTAGTRISPLRYVWCNCWLVPEAEQSCVILS